MFCIPSFLEAHPADPSHITLFTGGSSEHLWANHWQGAWISMSDFVNSPTTAITLCNSMKACLYRHRNKNANCKLVCTLQFRFIKVGTHTQKDLECMLIKIALFGEVKVLFPSVVTFFVNSVRIFQIFFNLINFIPLCSPVQLDKKLFDFCSHPLGLTAWGSGWQICPRASLSQEQLEAGSLDDKH